MLRSILITLFLHITSLAAQALYSNGLSLDDKVLGIERLLLTPETVIFPMTPFNLTLSGPPPEISGAQTVAQWVRTVLHDFITADVAAGTGGLDASISFEADRDENLGLVFSTMVGPRQSFINETIMGFNLFSTLEVPTADFIALGLAVSLTSYDPSQRMIKLRAARIDATKAGPLGVPKSDDSFEKSITTLASHVCPPSPRDFQDTCFEIFEKMMTTVPRRMKLSDPVVPRKWTLIEFHLELGPGEGVVYSGNISKYERGAVPGNAMYHYGKSSNGKFGSVLTSQVAVIQRNIVEGVVSDSFGDIACYSFKDKFTDPLISSFNIKDIDKKDA